VGKKGRPIAPFHAPEALSFPKAHRMSVALTSEDAKKISRAYFSYVYEALAPYGIKPKD
jgi:hypothetical protein